LKIFVCAENVKFLDPEEGKGEKEDRYLELVTKRESEGIYHNYNNSVSCYAELQHSSQGHMSANLRKLASPTACVRFGNDYTFCYYKNTLRIFPPALQACHLLADVFVRCLSCQCAGVS
jgi:hypothetical protein